MTDEAEATPPTVITNFKPFPIFALVGVPGTLMGVVLIVLASTGIYEALVLSDVPLGAYLEGMALILLSLSSMTGVMLLVKTPMKIIIQAQSIEVRRPSALLFSGPPHVKNIARERIARMKVLKVVTASASEGSTNSISYDAIFANKDGERISTVEHLTSTDAVQELADALNLDYEVLDE